MGSAKTDKYKRRFLKFDKKKNGVKSEELVLSETTPFLVREAYKALRTNLIFSLPEAHCKIILVTSSGAAEGKTTSCINMAITFAATGAKVCVVDCDLRKPKIARLCKEKGTPGLSNVLVNLNRLEDVIRKGKYENLDFIFSGDIPPNPAELLVSSNMDAVLQALAERYDYVFIDTPPVNVVTDTSLLVSRASGVLLVVNQQKTSKAELAKAIGQLEFVKARIFGVLLNEVKVEKQRRGSRYSRYYYQHYYALTDGERNND